MSKIALRGILIPKMTIGPGSTIALGLQPPVMTVGSGSNGVTVSTLSNGTLSLGAPPAGGTPSAGTITVPTSTTPATVTYTGISGSTLTGVTYVSGSASGTLATGAVIVLQGVIRTLPYMDFSWADEITVILTVNAVNGSPTGGSLTGQFLLGNPSTGDGLNSTPSTIQYADPAYTALDTQQLWTLIAEGEDWPNPIASYNMAAPVTVQRTIKDFGSMVDFVLSASTLTGGSSPTFTVSGVLIQRGG